MTTGLHVGFTLDGERHLVEAEDQCTALCGAELGVDVQRLTVLDLPWLGCDTCWDRAGLRFPQPWPG